LILWNASESGSFLKSILFSITKAEFSQLIRKRGSIKASLSRIEKFLKLHEENSNIKQLQFRSITLRGLWSEFKEVQENIEMLDATEYEECQKIEREQF
jgi:hypothetical protein